MTSPTYLRVAVTLVVYLYPAIVIVASRALRRTRVGAASIAATALTLAGVGVIVGGPEGIDTVGVTCALANAAGYAGYLLVGEPAVRIVGALTSYAVCGGLGGLMLLLGTLAAAGIGGQSAGASARWSASPPPDWSPPSWPARCNSPRSNALGVPRLR